MDRICASLINFREVRALFNLLTHDLNQLLRIIGVVGIWKHVLRRIETNRVLMPAENVDRIPTDSQPRAGNVAPIDGIARCRKLALQARHGVAQGAFLLGQFTVVLHLELANGSLHRVQIPLRLLQLREDGIERVRGIRRRQRAAGGDERARRDGENIIAAIAGEDHVAQQVDALAAEEHMLRAAEADPFRAQPHRLRRLLRRVGVRAHAELAVTVRPPQELLGGPAHLGRDALDGVEDDLARLAVDGDHLALAHHPAARLEHAPLLVDDDVVRAHDARLAHADGDHRRVRSPPAACGHDALRRVHTRHVLGRGLGPHEDHLLAVLGQLHRAVGVEHHLADGTARRSGQAAGEQPAAGEGALLVARIEERDEEPGEVARIHAQKRGVLVDDGLAHEVHRHLHRRRGRALARARLEQVQLALLDRELDVLHVLVVALEPVGDGEQLVVDLGHAALEVVDVLRGADARHDVFALRVGEELGVEAALTRARIAREADAGARGLAEIAEHHRHHGQGVQRRGLDQSTCVRDLVQLRHHQ